LQKPRGEKPLAIEDNLRGTLEVTFSEHQSRLRASHTAVVRISPSTWCEKPPTSDPSSDGANEPLGDWLRMAAEATVPLRPSSAVRSNRSLIVQNHRQSGHLPADTKGCLPPPGSAAQRVAWPITQAIEQVEIEDGPWLAAISDLVPP